MNILYAGDKESTPLYIEGALMQAGHQVTHITPEEALPDIEPYDLLFLSDYPALMVGRIDAESISEQVAAGKKLVMVGGWESFNGYGRNYANHPLADLLPVVMKNYDDRTNVPQGLLLNFSNVRRQTSAHRWDDPPVICGYNAADPKPGTSVAVTMKPIRYNGITIALDKPLPLVISWTYKAGSVVACLTDLTPHWSGGLTDWGDKMVVLPTGKEVGDKYIAFLRLLLSL